MRKKREKAPKHGVPLWLITFSDLMTLLLSFFVLFMSMSSLTQSSVAEVDAWIAPDNFTRRQGPDRVPERVTVFLELLKDPAGVIPNLERIRPLLFPRNSLPEEVSESVLEENIRVLEKPEGLAISLNDRLLFAKGQYTLAGPAEKILSSLVDILLYTSMDINISGHAESEPDAEISDYELSGKRALSVLEYFLQNKVRPNRFSVSGYGADRPAADSSLQSGSAANRRVEILLKNEMWLGGYR